MFAIAASVLVGASTVAEQAGGLDWLREPTAGASHAIVTALGLRTTLSGCEIITASRVLDVAATCIPAGIFAVYLALVIATRTSWQKRISGVMWGASLLFVANVVRVVAGVVAAQSAPEVFDALHGTVLQVVPIVTAFVAWLLWAGWRREG